MKTFLLTLMLMMATAVDNANTLTVFNSTNCTYTISTDGGTFPMWPYTVAFYDSPYDIGTGIPADGDFHVVKVLLPGVGGIDATSYGPYANTSAYGAPCNGGSPFNISWTWSGSDVIVHIY